MGRPTDEAITDVDTAIAEALSALISKLPIKLGLCYVVLQHLSPTYRSMLVPLFSRETAMAVREIEDGCSPEPNTIPNGYLFSRLLPVGEIEVYFGGIPRKATKTTLQGGLNESG